MLNSFATLCHKPISLSKTHHLSTNKHHTARPTPKLRDRAAKNQSIAVFQILDESQILSHLMVSSDTRWFLNIEDFSLKV
jgi:hypothetical protein